MRTHSMTNHACITWDNNAGKVAVLHRPLVIVSETVNRRFQIWGTGTAISPPHPFTVNGVLVADLISTSDMKLQEAGFTPFTLSLHNFLFCSVLQNWQAAARQCYFPDTM